MEDAEFEAAKRAIDGDPESSEFTDAHRRALMDAVSSWFKTAGATGLSYAGLAALLRDLADEFG